MHKGHFINLAGPSAGAGKSVIIDKLLKKHGFNLVRLSTYTTRPPRPNDLLDRASRRFISLEEFQKLKAQNFFFETKRLHHAWYGTPIKEIEEWLSAGKNIISDVDAQRIQKFRTRFPTMIGIFVDVPNRLLKKRMIERGDSPKEIRARLKVAARERRFKKYYDKVVVNDQGKLDEVVTEIANYLESRLE